MQDACPHILLPVPYRSNIARSSVPYRSAMRLREFLRADFVISRLQANDMEGVVHEICARADAAGIGSGAVIAEKLLEREHGHTTVIGSGLAIPHATVPDLPEPVIGVALAKDPIRFGPAGTDAVRLLFVLLSPPGREREHVKLLARICRLARHSDFIDQLEAADDDATVIEIIEFIDDQHV